MFVRRSRLAHRTGSLPAAAKSRRSSSRNANRLEKLEDRVLLAVGPQLVGIQPNSGELLLDGDVRNIAPRELSFRLDDTQIIDPATLDGIRITQSGFDGEFEHAAATTDFNTNGAVTAEFVSVEAGIAGERITVDIAKSDLGLLAPPRIAVAGQTVTFTLNTNAASPTTVDDLVIALANDSAASRLLRLNVLAGSGSTDIATPAATYAPLQLHGYNAAQAVFDFDTGGAVQIELTAVQEGVSQNGLTVRFTKSNHNNASGPTVFVQNGIVNVDLNQNGLNVSSASEVVDAINNNLLASQIVEARQIVGLPGVDITTPLAASVANPRFVTLDGANDLIITPGFIGVQPTPDENEVIVRFAEALPDDIYRIEVFGFDDAQLGITALRNTMGDAFMPQSGEFDSLEFELDLGAQVVGVVPQPARRVGGQIIHERNVIEVYFNDDDLFGSAISTGDLLNDPSVVDPRFYQLIFTSDTVRNTDDEVFNPESISYDPANDRAVLTFPSDLGDLIDASLGGAGTFRLRIGTNELSPTRPAPLPPVQVNLDSVTSNDFGSNGTVTITFEATQDFARAPRIEVTKANLGPTSGPRLAVRENVISVTLNTNSLSLTTAQEFVDAVNSHREASRLVDVSIVGSGAFTIAISAPPELSLQVGGFGSSFATASNLDVLTDQSLIISSSIDPQEPIVRRVADRDTIGHVEIPEEAVDGFEQHINPLFPNDSQAGATTLFYNFRPDYGTDPNGVPLINAINDDQRERAREGLELWGEHLGIQFVETPDSGITFATGDLRVLDEAEATVFAHSIGATDFYEVQVDPTYDNSMVLMNVNVNWDNDFAGSWFHNVMSGIGFALGLGRTGDLPPSTVMALAGSLVEPIYPGDHDIAHGLQLHDTDSNDVDLYRFEIDFDDPAKTGNFTAEIFAERQHQASDLDTVVTLYKEIIVDRGHGPETDWDLIARNDDYFSEDSFLELELNAGVYFIGVSASGNDRYDPTIEDTGQDGRTHGKYDLRLTFRPQVDTVDTITDDDRSELGLIGTSLDGDGDGTPGGVFNFWFQTRPEDRTVYVDKAFNTNSSLPRGTITNPYNQIDEALNATDPAERVDRGDIIRIVANGGADGDLSTLGDNLAYEIGFGTQNGVILSDGSTFNVPRDVTVMIDPGAIFKLRRARIGVGSSTLGVNRANGALQVLGTPENQVIFTSYNDQTIGVDTNPSNTTPAKGDWGGLSFRRNLDDAEGRFHYEDVGVFLNYVNQADISFGGGGNVVVDSNQQIINPIHIVNTRPTITYNTITGSADSAMSAAPDSFEETNFHEFEHQISGAFTSDYQRIGPDVHGNTLRNNSTNALFVRVETPAGGDIRPLTVPGRFNDLDIVHVIAENLPIESTPGRAILETVQPSVDLVTFTSEAGGSLAEGTYRYKVAFVDANGFEGLPSDPTALGTVNPGDGTLELLNLPGSSGDFVARRIYRSQDGGAGPYTLVRDINASATTFTDDGNDVGGFLNFDPVDASSVTLSAVPGGTLNAGDYNYIMTFVDSTGATSAPTDPTTTFTLDAVATAAGDRSVRLDNLPAPFHGEGVRRIYRSFNNGSGPYTLIAEIDSSLTTFTDTGTSLGEQLPITAFGVLRPRLDASLVVDPGTVVKLEGSRINVDFGAQLLAEGFEGQEVIFTSKLDDRYGAGGTFDTNNDDTQGANEASPSPRDWGGFYFAHSSSGSIEHAFIGFGGGITKIEGTFKAFNVIEVHSADFRLAHSVVESNSNGQGGQGPATRLGRTANASATVFVRDAQPLIIDNIFRDNVTGGSVIHINVNSFTAEVIGDIGRSTGFIDRVEGLDNNQGPLVSDNRLENNQLNGMEIRGGETTGEKVMDDTDIVHIVRSNIVVRNVHQTGGLRLESQPDESLVVKLFGPGQNFTRDAGAGFIVDGDPSNIEDRVGGVLQIVGQPGFPVVLTSLADDTVGAGVQPNGDAQVDTNNDGAATVPFRNDWRGVIIDRYAHDRNVAWVLEQELVDAIAPGINATTNTAQNLGDLAPNQKNGDENLRLGWDINGYLNEPTDIDIYSFRAEAGTEIWVDIDETRNTVDTVIELLNADGDVIARTDNSHDESRDPSLLVANPGISDNSVNSLERNARNDFDFYSTNPRDAGFRVTLPGAVGTRSTFFFRVTSADSLTSGVYDLQIRMRETDDFPGSTVRSADLRFAQNAIQIFGHPAHSPLVGEVGENEPLVVTPNPYELPLIFESNDNFGGNGFVPADGPQIIGNLLEQDRGVLSIAGGLSSEADVDFYRFDVNYPSVSTAVNAALHSALIFDLDYADGLNRPNTSLWIFDAAGRLILAGRDSNVADDRPRLNQTDFSDLSHGSFGAQDPYIGSVEMPTGTYFAAITSNDRVPAELVNNPFLRLEPIDSLIRIAEDHIGTDGFGGSTASDPVVPVLLDNSSITPEATNLWHITDQRAGDPGHGINPSFDGSRSGAAISTLPQPEIEPNNLFNAPQNIDAGPWNLAFDANIGDNFGNTSTVIPHITIEGTGDGTFDYYSFTVAQPNSRAIFDIDFGFGGPIGTSIDTELFLFDAVGNLLTSNDDASIFAGAGGSNFGLDAYIEGAFAIPGTYIIGVGQFNSTVNGNIAPIVGTPPNLGQTYTLQISLENHPVGAVGGSNGGQSFYFGNEATGNYDNGARAQGSLISNPFSLEGYAAEDRPVMYFNYFLETEDDNGAPFATNDGFRVYMVLANGDEHLLATNNGFQGPNPADDEFDDPDLLDAIEVDVQELIDNSGNWRQARIALDSFAGLGDLRLRFEFDSVNGNNNAFEGAYVDDLIIGFAERGEMVTSAAGDATFVVNPDAPGGEIASGEYQLEIRTGTRTGESTGGVPSLRLVHSYDTNDRLLQQLSMIAPAGSEVFDGQTFVLSDGSDQLTFEFDNNNQIQGGNTRVLFNAADPATTIARRIRDAINNPAVQSFLDVEAATGDGRIAGGSSSSDRVRIFGNAQLIVDSIKGELAAGTTSGSDRTFLFQNDLGQSITRIVITLPSGLSINSAVRESTASDDVGSVYTVAATDIIEATFDNFLPGSEVLFGANIGPGDVFGDQLVGATVSITLRDGTVLNGEFVRGAAGLSGVLDLGGTVIPVLDNGHGDLNLLRDQGQVIIDSNRIFNSKDFGIVSNTGARNAETPADSILFGMPHIGPVRNLHVVNDIEDGGLVPGVVISNNEISGEGLGGIHFSGNVRPWEITTLRPAAFPDQFFTGFTAGDMVVDGSFFDVTLGDTTVRFEFEDLNGPFEGGDGWTEGSIPVYYRTSSATAYLGRIPGYTQQEMANAIRDAIQGSILVTNDTSYHVDAIADFSRYVSDPIFGTGPDPAVHVLDAVSIVIPPQPFPDPFFLRQTPIAESPRPFGRVINNTIYGDAGDEGLFSGRAPGTPDEPNDQISTAIDTKQGRANLPETFVHTGTIGDSGALRSDNTQDVDFYEFQLHRGERVRIDLDSTAGVSNLDSVLRLFNSAGVELALNDNGAAPGEGASLDSYIDFTATTTDSYYVAVSGLGNTNYDPISLGNRSGPASTGDYTITIDVLAPRNWAMRALQGDQIADGTTFTIGQIQDLPGMPGVNTVTFEFDVGAPTYNGVAPGNVPILVRGEDARGMPPEQGPGAPAGSRGPGYLEPEVAVAIATAINGQNMSALMSLQGSTGIMATPLGGAEGAEGPLPLRLPDNIDFIRPLPLSEFGHDYIYTPPEATTELFVYIEGATLVEFTPGSPGSLPLDPLFGGQMADELRETGIYLTDRSSPTVLNNILANNNRGVIQASSPGTVVGANLYQHNLTDDNVSAPNEDFNITLGDFEPLFVDASNRDFTPAEFARSIDSAVDSLLERSLFSAFKSPLGISDSPVLAPDRDVTGQLRVDDPDVATPSGQGANVFKDRGALDRADFVGPGAIITNPRDNDALGLDINGQATIIELTQGSLQNFTFQLVDGFESSDPFPGTGVDPDTVKSPAVTVFENGRLLEEGIDYTVSFAPTTSLLVVQPVAGVWRRDKIYEVKLNNQDRFVIELPTVADARDGDRFSVTDGNGNTATFEFDRGYVIDVPETLELQIPTNANRAGGVEDGHRFTITDAAGTSMTFEYDSNGAPGNPLVLAGNQPIFIANAFTPELVAEATVTALQVSGLGLGAKTLLGGRVHVGTPDGYRIDTTFAPTLELPASTLAVQVPAAGGTVILDGQTFSVTNPDGTTTTFEFDDGTVPGVAGNNLPITIAPLATQQAIATAIETAINTTIGVEFTAIDLGNGIVHLGLDDGYSLDMGTSNLFRLGLSRLVNDTEAIIADDGTGAVTLEFDNNGTSSSGTTIPFTIADTHEELAEKIAVAFRQAGLASLSGATHLGDGRIQLGGIPGDVVDTAAVMGSYPLGVFPGLNVVGTPGVSPSLSIQVPVDGGMAPTGVTDGETFTISNGNTSVTFEFNLASDINVGQGNQPIIFTATSDQAEVAASIAGAIRSSGLGLNAFVEMFGVVNLASTIEHSLDLTGAPSLAMLGVPGGSVAMSIPADPTFNDTDLRNLVINSINMGPLTAVASSPRGGNTIFVDGAISISDGIDNFFLQAIKDLAGNPLKPNQPTDETVFTIVTPPTPLPPGSVVDYGDAPDGIGGFNYPTLSSNNGAVHLIGTDAMFLGGGVDAETDGQPTLAADGDDTLNIVAAVDLSDSTLMQPDRVILLVVPGAGGGPGGVTDQETFTISEGGSQVVFEFDNNDSVASNSVVAFDAQSSAFDIAEAIKEAIDLELPGLNATVVGDSVRIELTATQSVNTLNTSVVQRPEQPIQIEVPAAGGAAINEGDTFTISTPANTIRFEFTTDANIMLGSRPIIYSPNDTRDEIALLIVEAILDTNLGLVPAAIGNGLIVIDGDDEDGVRFRGALNSNTITEVTVTASAVGRLDAWIDYNQDGDWNDPGEKVFNNIELTAGENALSLRAPATAALGATYARFRFSAAGNLLPTGLALAGEVEDYLINVVGGFPPTALNDTNYSTDENTPLVVDGINFPSVLTNDIDPDGQTLIVGEYDITSAFGASVTVNPDGTFTYDPSGVAVFNSLDDGEMLLDTFTYSAYDGADPTANDGLFSNTGTVAVTVSGINDGPVTQPDGPYTTDEDNTLTVGAANGLLANDIDVEGDTIVAVLETVLSARGATVSILPNGGFSYDPTTSAELQAMSPSDSLDDTFVYQASDGDSVNTGVATVTVNGLNDAPIAVADDLGHSTNEDSPVNIPTGILANDIDPEGDVVTVASTGTIISAAGATITMNANGSYNYDPRTSTSLQTLAEGATGTDTFTYTITDGQLTSAPVTVTLTIDGRNDAPTANPDTATTPENSVLQLDGSVLTANDVEIDIGDMLMVDLLSGTSSLGALISVSGGVVSYDPTAVPIFQSLRPGQQLNDTFDYVIRDGSGLTDVATVTVTVTGESDPPQPADDFFTVSEDALLDIDAPGVLLNDVNLEGDGMVVTQSQFISTQGASVRIFSDGQISYDPRSAANLQALGQGETIDDTFIYTVSDLGGAAATATVTVTVTGVNDAPIARNDSFTAEQGLITVISAPGVLGNDNDPEGTAVTVVEVITQPERGVLTLNADGSLSYDHDDTPASLVNSDSFSYRIQDASGATDTATATISIIPRLFPWQNPRNPFDVNDDGNVTIADAFAVIAELRANGIRALETDLPASIGPAFPAPYVDVDANNLITLTDALLVTREVKRLQSNPEGEASAKVAFGVTQEDISADSGSLRSVKLARTSSGEGAADIDGGEGDYAVPGILPTETREEETADFIADDLVNDELDLDQIAGDIASQWTQE